MNLPYLMRKTRRTFTVKRNGIFYGYRETTNTSYNRPTLPIGHSLPEKEGRFCSQCNDILAIGYKRKLCPGCLEGNKMAPQIIEMKDNYRQRIGESWGPIKPPSGYPKGSKYVRVNGELKIDFSHVV